jgi:AraC family transcriptional regulator
MKSPGTPLREKQSGPFRVIEKTYAAGASLGRHEHESAYVSFLLAGSYMEFSREEERNCLPGTVIWHPKTEAHADRFNSSGGHLLDLEIDAEWLGDAAQEFKLEPRARLFRGGFPYSLGLRVYRQISASPCEVEEAATELMSFFFRGPLDRHRPAWFNRALEICGEIRDPQLSLGKLASVLHIHPVHVARSFRRFMGCTFGEYLAETRIRKAFELLRNSKRPIVEIAYACGFADHAHLCRALKNSTGLTPSAFRQSLQSGELRTQEVRPQ